MSVLDIAFKPFKKVFGTRNDRLVKAYRRRALEIGQLEPQIRKLSDVELRQDLQSGNGSGQIS